MTRKIFIAGHNGMVGSAICRKFKKAGNSQLLTKDRSELDLTNQTKTVEWLKAQKPDVVIIAAAKVGGIQANIDEPFSFLSENVQMAANTIIGSFLAGVPKLIFLGSSCMYPRGCSQPMKESDLMTGPCEPTNEGYAIAKLTGWKLCETIRQQHHLEYSCIVPCNLYGPNDNYHSSHSHVIPGLIRRFHEAKMTGSDQVSIWGTGKPTREFLHVDDLADAIYFLSQLPELPSVINAGTGIDQSISELVELIKKITKFSGDVQYDHTKPDGMPRKCMDISTILKLGWTPKITLEEGLKEVISSNPIE